RKALPRSSSRAPGKTSITHPVAVISDGEAPYHAHARRHHLDTARRLYSALAVGNQSRRAPYLAVYLGTCCLVFRPAFVLACPDVRQRLLQSAHHIALLQELYTAGVGDGAIAPHLWHHLSTSATRLVATPLHFLLRRHLSGLDHVLACLAALYEQLVELSP